MSTLENLFVQIFDRKNWIVDQLKQQKELYDQYLASTLLIKGIRPPSWLLGSGFDGEGSAELKELKKEELISGLLFPPPRPNFPFTGGHSYHYNRPITAANFGQLSNAFFTDTCASNKNVNLGEASSLVPKCDLNYSEVDLECALHGTSGKENIITSPQSKREKPRADFHSEQDQSLSRIQRSRSRQKALELRNSGKASSKKRQWEESCTDAYTGRVTRSRNCVHQTVELQNLSNCPRETGCRLTPVSVNGNDDLLYAPDSQEIVQDFRSGQNDLECTSIVSNLQAEFNRSADAQLLEKDQTQAHEVKPDSCELDKLNDISADKSDGLDVDFSPMAETSKLYAQPVMKGAPESGEDIVSSTHTKDDKNSQQEPIESLEEAGRSDDRHEKCDLSIETDLLEKDEIEEDALEEENHAKRISSVDELEDASEEENYAKCNSSLDEQLLGKGQFVEIIKSEEKLKPDHGCYEADKLDDVPTEKSKFDICSSRTDKTVVSAQSAIGAAFEFDEDFISNTDLHDHKSVQQEPIESLEQESRSDDMHEKCGSFVEEELLEIHQTAKASVEEKHLGQFHETQEEDGSMIHLCANFLTEKSPNSSLSLKNGISEIQEDFMSYASQQSNELLQELISPDPRSAGQLSPRSPSASQLDVSVHGVDGNSEECSFVEKCTERINMLPIIVLPQDSKCDTDLCVWPRESLSCDINDGSGLSHLQKPEMFLGFHKNESSAASATVSAKVIDSKKALAPITSQIHNLSHDSPYFLRSYFNHNAGVKVNGSCSEVVNWTSIQRCAPENSWPAYKRRKIGSQSSGLFTTSPRPKQVKLYKKSLPVLNVHHFPINNTEVTYSSDQVHKTLSERLQSPKAEQCMEGIDLQANTFLGLEKPDVRNSFDSSQYCLDDNDEVRLDLEGRFSLEVHRKGYSLGNTENIERTERSFLMEDSGHERESNNGELVSYCSIGSPNNGDVDSVGGDQYLPEFEGFSVDASTDTVVPDIAGDEISSDKLDLPRNASERISFLEKLCRSASILTPLHSTNYKLHNSLSINRSLPNGRIDFRDSVIFSNEEQLKASYNAFDAEICHSAHCNDTSSSNVKFDSDARKPSCTPPVTKFCQKITSFSSGHSSEKQQSMNPELTCFRIDEDTDTSEEDESKYKVFDPLQKEDGSEQKINATIRSPLVDMTNKFNPSMLVSAMEKINDRGSVESINAELNFNEAQLQAEQKLENGYRKVRRSNRGKENNNSSLGVNGLEKTTEVLNNRFSRSKVSGKVSYKKGNPDSLAKGQKHNNIVSNVSSFIPLVQQKSQPAPVYTGKRDVKVKALEAAEAAKRLEEKKENDRKLKKEASKLERARLEQEKLKQLELQQKKKVEEKKKKEAEIATRKRLREEEEKKEKERKRKCIEEARRLQKVQEEKLRAEKEEKEQQRRIAAEKEAKRKQQQIEERYHQRREKGNEQSDFRQKLISNAGSSSIVAGDARKECELREGLTALEESHDKLSNDFCKTNESEALTAEAIGKQSYELSPYKDSDDEEDEEEEDDDDELPNNKFVPSWASGKNLALALPFTQQREPSEIFTPARNCSIVEVFFPQVNSNVAPLRIWKIRCICKGTFCNPSRIYACQTTRGTFLEFNDLGSN
ncbi:hypothetical protein Sjap_003826 [Stephania japonica]|uniref:Inner centromere protein ARK-binding domain-containing protein n=1 Tax=Stephania japonica TaxID=461633 RepID=A0AAP0KPP3_9MAGN